MDLLSKSIWLKSKAFELGFDAIGVSKARFLEEEAPRLDQWLNQNHHGQMSYLSNYFDMRLDPRKLMQGTKSVISLMVNYFPQEVLGGNTKLAKYAYGKDYHKIVKKRLLILIDEMRKKFGDFQARAFVDSAPIMERQWASISGLGWIGKNTLLLNKNKGSFFFLCEILCDLELEYDVPVLNHCGTCTACIDACPTDALFAPYKMDASKCISYLTIELKENIPTEFKSSMENWAFGCDICQDVCPWNSKSKPHQWTDFQPNLSLKEWSQRDFEEITLEAFNHTFSGSAVKRTKYEGFIRNLKFLK